MSRAPTAFGAVLRQLRTAAALSQLELAERAGLSPRGISDLERGARRTPHLATVSLLADALALSPADRQALLAAARPVAQPETLSPPFAWEGKAVELLERETDLAQLAEHYRQAAAGYGRVVFVAGEAGIGKTSLVDTFCRHVADRATVLRASCDALSTPAPLGPLRDLAPALGLQLQHHLADVEGRDQLFRAVLDAVTTREGLTVLVAEDAHWADGATIELLRFLARRISEHKLLIIVTYRDDEISGDHSLRLLLGDLATAATVHRQRLQPLSEVAVRRLAMGSERDVGRLYRLTGGNPFFVTEVLAAGGFGVPASVGDAVLARAARLAPEARAVLDLAAVIGATIDAELLVAVAGPVLDESDECVTRGLLHWDDESLSFRHALAREAILAAIPPPRRRLVHARVLTALRDSPKTQGNPALLAHHAEAAGDGGAVLEFAIAAAEQAAALHAYREVAAQYERALRFADALPASERVRLLEGRAVAYYLSGQGEEAVTARHAALDLWRTLGNPLKEGENLCWLSRVYWYAGHGAEAETAAIAALDVLESLAPGPELAMSYSNLAQLRMLDSNLGETLRWGERAIALAEQLGEMETLVHALINVSTARNMAGDERGQGELRRSLQLAHDHGLVDHAGRALLNLAWCPLWNMELDEVDRRIATALAYAIEHDLDFYRWYLVATQVDLRARQGAWDAAEAEAHHLLRQPRMSPVTRIVALTALGQVHARRGNPAATAVLDEALLLAEQNGQLMRQGPVRAARADAALLDGDIARARAEADAVRDRVFSHGNRWLRGEFAWLLWQAGERNVPTDGLSEPHALQIAGDWAGAAAAWQALGCPYEEARALAESDDPVHVRRAIAIFERLDAQPALAQAIGRLRTRGVRDVPAQQRRHARQVPTGTVVRGS